MDRPLPPRPVRPEPAVTSSRGASSWFTIALALAAGLFLLAGFGALLFVLFASMAPLIAVGGIFALAAFHYVVWGWWLGGMIRREAEKSEAEAAEESSSRLASPAAPKQAD